MASRLATPPLAAGPSPPLARHPEASPPPTLRRRTTRRAAAAALATTFLAGTPLLSQQRPARPIEFGFTAPDQTLEEAEAGVKVHSRGLLQLGPLLESQAWRELQLALRDSGPRLKQDIYTIIQSKAGVERPTLRKLYSILFNNVTRLDYAARSKDANLAHEHYRNILAALEDILRRI